MTVFITTAVIIYFSFIMFSLFAAVQQIKVEKLTNRRSNSSPKKFSLFRHQQTKIVLATSARSLSLWIFSLVFLLTDLPETLWSLNHTLSKILLYNGIYDNGYEVWTVMLPILTLYILYEIHFSFFRCILNLNSKEKSVLPFTVVNRLSIFVIGLYFIVNCILLEDISKILSLVTAFSLGRALFPLFKYNYILWAYPVQPMTDPWLSQETSDIAKRNKITVNRMLIVKYPSTDHEGVQCLFGNLLVDSRLLHWQTDFTWQLPTVPNLNSNYVPTVAQKEVRTMITHALGCWVNYHEPKMYLIFICKLAGVTAALTLNTLLALELNSPSPINIEIELKNKTEIDALFQEQRLRASCMSLLVVLLGLVFPIIYTCYLIQNICAQQLEIDADFFTLHNFQGKQLCHLLEQQVPEKTAGFPGQHWAYQILYPKRQALIVERIDIMKKSLEKIMYF